MNTCSAYYQSVNKAFAYESHGIFGGASTWARGGNFSIGFASGAVATSIASCTGNLADKLPIGWKITCMVAAGGLSAGVTATMAGGNFWEGVCSGLICAGLNHAMHLVVEGSVFVKGCKALGVSCTGPIPEEMQNDAFLGEAQKTWFPDAPMGKLYENIFTVENVPQAIQENMDAIEAPAQTRGLYNKISDNFTGMSKVYFNKSLCFKSAFKLFETMGHELVHVSQYAYLGSIGYLHSDFEKNNILVTMDHWAYNYELYLRGGVIQHGLQSNVPLYNELDYVNFNWSLINK